MKLVVTLADLTWACNLEQLYCRCQFFSFYILFSAKLQNKPSVFSSRAPYHVSNEKGGSTMLFSELCFFT